MTTKDELNELELLDEPSTAGVPDVAIDDTLENISAGAPVSTYTCIFASCTAGWPGG